MHAPGRTVLLLLALGLCAAIRAPVGAVAAAQPQDRAASFTADVELVLQAIAVLDATGQPVTGLTREEFNVAEDGTTQEIALFLAPDAAPLDVALVMDSSNSLSFWAQVVRRAARTFLASLEPEDCVYLLPFNDGVGPGSWGRAVDPAMGRRIDAIFMSGNTSLYDAVLDGLSAIERATNAAITEVGALPGPAPNAQATGAVRASCGVPPVSQEVGGPQRRRAVVLLTDGDDQGSEHRFDEVLDEARRASIPIFPVVIGDARNDERLKATLVALAGNTGGTVIESVAADNLRAAYDDVVALLRASYLIGYRPAMMAADGPRWRQVTVRSRRPSYRLVHRTRYYR